MMRRYAKGKINPGFGLRMLEFTGGWVSSGLMPSSGRGAGCRRGLELAACGADVCGDGTGPTRDRDHTGTVGSGAVAATANLRLKQLSTT